MQSKMRLYGLLCLTLCAFAGNSILTRAALVDPLNTPLSFASVRLVSGALVLFVLVRSRAGQWQPKPRDLPAIVSLFLYAVGFSLAYLSMSAASGALILFAMVQITMLTISALQGHRLSRSALLGAFVALSGLAWLLFPGLSAPPLKSALFMALAGAAWGIYSLLGRGAEAPVDRTARNFIGSVPLVALVTVFSGLSLTGFGWGMALLSGAVTSALGYALWYAVLPRLTPAMAASAQLSVPVLTAFAGAALLAEPIGLRMIAASVLILGGVWLTARR